MASEVSEEHRRDSAGHALLPSNPPSSRPPRTVLGVLPWMLVVLVALAEVGGHFTIISRVPPEADWRAAGAFVREQLQADDTVVAGPSWADPLMRREVGGSLSLAAVGMSSIAPFDRLWMFSIRGNSSPWAPARAPDFERAFGRVRVLRWDLGPSRVVYDFADHLHDARVDFEERGRTRECLLQHGPSSPGGLSRGPSMPRERFVCDPGRHWLWVGTTVMEDLSLEPRRCVYEHPTGPEPFRVTFRDVPLGERLVLYGGVFSEHERMEELPDIRLRVLADGREIATLLHRDGEGFKRLEATTTPGLAHELVVEVTSPVADRRTFCWSATTRRGSTGRTP